jgi:mannose-6-phosphate isomerase-like protein (cupin superfamily)
MAKKRAELRRKTAVATRKPKQRFHVKHERAEDFDAGLRSYASYRDLGLAEATTGMVQAHVIRMVPPCDPKVVSKWHYHDVNLQFIYVLKGWIKNEFEGNGVHTMKQGTCWLQPPKIRHRVLDYSSDCELLEIVLPAKFDTVELEK